MRWQIFDKIGSITPFFFPLLIKPKPSLFQKWNLSYPGHSASPGHLPLASSLAVTNQENETSVKASGERRLNKK